MAGRWREITTVAAVLAVGPACAPLSDLLSPSPRVPVEWHALIGEVRAFERRIGFRATDNFLKFSETHRSYAFCGYATQRALPYSYEDPAIQWIDASSPEECGRSGAGADVYFGRVEVFGESGAAVTPSMIGSRLERFLYLVLHEDCHDQFDFPYGIEEALCNLIAYQAMTDFGEERFGRGTDEDRAVRRYTERESIRTHSTKLYYEELEHLYARHSRNDVSDNGLRTERVRILDRAANSMSLKAGTMNDVILANHMTYSRHYAFLERVLEDHGRDLKRIFAFFQHVDRIKPSRETVMQRHAIASAKSVEFLRAYEGAVIDTIRRELAREGPPSATENR